MKEVTIQEAQGKLAQLVAEAQRGELIVLTDGENKVTLHPGKPLDLEQDSPELEAELLKAANGPFTPYQPGELRELANKVLEKHRAKAQR